MKFSRFCMSSTPISRMPDFQVMLVYLPICVMLSPYISDRDDRVESIQKPPSQMPSGDEAADKPWA